MALATLVLAGLAAALAPPASAATAVDLDLSYAPLEDTGCRAWSGTGNVQWNLTLAMNGTDGSLTTTPTYLFVDRSSIPVDDGWSFVLAASTAPTAPPAYDDASSNSLAIGSSVYNASSSGMDLYLYSASHDPAAPAANITISLTPSPTSPNESYRFNLTAITHRSGVTPAVARTLSLCVNYPMFPSFDMGRASDSLEAAADTELTVSFWLNNTGNTRDTYACQAVVGNASWPWRFFALPNNRTGSVALGANVTIRVGLTVPAAARARANSTVALGCTSEKEPSLSVETAPTFVEVTQYYYCYGAIPPSPPSSLAGFPGETVAFRLVVENRGNGNDRCAARVATGLGPAWIATLSPSEMDLPPSPDSGYQTMVTMNVTIPSDAALGTTDIDVNVTSTANLTTPITVLRFHVQVRQVYAPAVTTPPAQVALPSAEVVFNVTITNGGNGLDSLVVAIVNLSDWRVFVSPPIREKLLEAGEKADFHFTVIVPTHPSAGPYNQTIRITSSYAALDAGLDIFVETVLTVVVLPVRDCAVTPLATDTELNPFAFPAGAATVNFILAVDNTGNGADELTMSATAPWLFEVTFSPTHVQIGAGESKAVLITIGTPEETPAGEYVVVVTARSDFDVSASCTSTYNLIIYHKDVGLSTTVQAFIQDPENPQNENAPVTLPAVTLVDGFLVRFRLTLQNLGDRAIAAGEVSFVVYDTLDCVVAPIGAVSDTCGTRIVFNWTNPTNIIAGPGGSVVVEFSYVAPEFLCFEAAECNGGTPPPPANARLISFEARMADEADTTNNAANVTVEVHPRPILGPHLPPNTNGTDPGAGASAAGTSPLIAAALVAAVGVAGTVIAMALLWSRRKRPGP